MKANLRSVWASSAFGIVTKSLNIFLNIKSFDVYIVPYFVLNLKLCSTVLQCCSEDVSPWGPAPGPTTSSSSHSTWCPGIIMSRGNKHWLVLRSHFYPRWIWHHRRLWFSKLSWYVFWCKTRTLSPNVHFTRHNYAMNDVDVIICCDDALEMTLSLDSMWWLMTGPWAGLAGTRGRPRPRLMEPEPPLAPLPVRARPRPGQAASGPGLRWSQHSPLPNPLPSRTQISQNKW